MARLFSRSSLEWAPLARGLFVAAMVSGTALTMVARAAEGGAYTPEPGSSERRAITEALHRGGGRGDRVFAVRQMVVRDGWAWTAVDPSPLSGMRPREEPESALLRQIDGQWRVVARLCTEEGCETAAEVRRIRRDNPGSPSEIFPVR